MEFKRFSWLLAFRILLIVLVLALCTQLTIHDGYQITSLTLAIVLVVQIYELVLFAHKTNTEIIRFLKTMQDADFSQRFELQSLGPSFGELGERFNNIIAKIQRKQQAQEQELKHLKALVEHAPVPLISIYENNKLTLWNNSARHLFGRHSVNHIDDLKVFGKQFGHQLTKLALGQRDLINISIDGQEHRLSVAATQITQAKTKQTLFSLQDIQTELDSAQLEAWQDLVSVLTHEIMNSITPVTSLAKTAVDIVGDVKNHPQLSTEIKQELDDVAHAVDTVARRSEGLMGFVTSYRRLTRVPAPNKKMVKISDLILRVKRLATQDWPALGINLSISIQPPTLDLHIDSSLIEQVFLNLLKNAEYAVLDKPNPNISIYAYLNLRGKVVIEVSNNGVVIPEKVASQIFVPFFTTKSKGSGVGLALSRQIMLAHQGNISLKHNLENKGGSTTVTFSLTF
jgi:nitrogen fixation/metabolism regulation signal transduction histidine kinase